MVPKPVTSAVTTRVSQGSFSASTMIGDAIGTITMDARRSGRRGLRRSAVAPAASAPMAENKKITVHAPAPPVEQVARERLRRQADVQRQVQAREVERANPETRRINRKRVPWPDGD